MHDLNKVFVYGTLKVGGYYAKRFDKVRISSRRATLKGTMLSLVSFPGVTLKGNNTIVGEIHEYENINSVMKTLDLIEGCSGTKGKDNDLYHREVVKVSTNSSEEDAWVYTINVKNKRIPQNLEVVETGEWKID